MRSAFVAALFLYAISLACSPMPDGPVVHRTDANEDIDLSGEWNDVDSGWFLKKWSRIFLLDRGSTNFEIPRDKSRRWL